MLDTWNVFGIYWFLQLAFYQLSLIWWDVYLVEVGEPVWLSFSYWVIAGNPLLTHSWSNEWDCVFPGNLFIGVPLWGESPPFGWCHFSEENLLRHLHVNSSFISLQGHWFLGNSSLQWYTRLHHFFSKFNSPFINWGSKSLSFLLLCIRCWQGISCFSKNLTSSVPDSQGYFCLTWSY